VPAINEDFWINSIFEGQPVNSRAQESPNRWDATER
jgi:hypothetical protein